MEAMISIPESLYNQLLDYFDNRSDADGDSQGVYPNEEMRILSELENCVQIKKASVKTKAGRC